jgi:hypothetical protein
VREGRACPAAEADGLPLVLDTKTDC